MKLRDNSFIEILISVFIITGMVFVSQQTGEKEVIFPELAAICTGVFLAPKIPWRVNIPQMIFFISLCSVLGTIISIFLNVPFYARLGVAYMLSQAVYVFSRTTFAPMVSAVCLPVFLNTDGYACIVSAFSLVCFVSLVYLAASSRGIKQSTEFVGISLPKKKDIIFVGIRCIAAALFIWAAVFIDMRFCAAPPLFVAFTELTGAKTLTFKRICTVSAFVIGCAFWGSFCRLVLSSLFAFPLYGAAMASILGVAAVMKIFKVYIPPAAAMAVLPMLIDEKFLFVYPLQVGLGMSAIAVIAFFLVTLRRKLWKIRIR